MSIKYIHRVTEAPRIMLKAPRNRIMTKAPRTMIKAPRITMKAPRITIKALRIMIFDHLRQLWFSIHPLSDKLCYVIMFFCACKMAIL